MNELVTYETYEQFKTALDTEILSAAESFVKIGWLLKQARDTTILYESGYDNLYDFAKAEYGIDKGTVSRYIAINDRFSIGGNAPALEDKYSGRGVAKLQEMLTLSDEVIEVIPEQVTKAEIQEIKRDIKAEQEKTDIEVLFEDATPNPRAEEIELLSMGMKTLYHLLKEDKEVYARVGKVFEESKSMENWNDNDYKEQIMKALAPTGVATPRARVPQVGTILMSIQGLDHNMQFVNVRTNEKESVDWITITDWMYMWFGFDIRTNKTIEQSYEFLYGEKFEEVAPVQPVVEEKQKSEKQETKAQEPEAGNGNMGSNETKIEEATRRTDEEPTNAINPQSHEDSVLDTENSVENACEIKENQALEDIPEVIDTNCVEVSEERSISAAVHNDLVMLGESIAKALYEQNYESAKSYAERIVEVINNARQ